MPTSDQLSERELRVLEAVVQTYIETAEPAGSQTIARRFGLGVSAATIRNTMADLEDMGFLTHPHTSAGRVPTDKAYRFYVNVLGEVPWKAAPDGQKTAEATPPSADGAVRVAGNSSFGGSCTSSDGDSWGRCLQSRRGSRKVWVLPLYLFAFLRRAGCLRRSNWRVMTDKPTASRECNLKRDRPIGHACCRFWKCKLRWAGTKGPTYQRDPAGFSCVFKFSSAVIKNSLR